MSLTFLADGIIETGIAVYVVLGGLELAMQSRLAWNSEIYLPVPQMLGLDGATTRHTAFSYRRMTCSVIRPPLPSVYLFLPLIFQ